MQLISIKKAIILGLFLGSTYCVAISQNSENLITHYQYCRCKSLNEEVKLIKEDKFVKQYRIFYESVNNQRVSAILNIPQVTKENKKHGPPWPCVFFMHPHNSDKSLVNLFIYDYAKKGIATFAIDGLYSGERKMKGEDILNESLHQTVANMKQQVLDILRGLDLLSRRPDIDNNRIGFFGLSLGALTGIIGCSVNNNIRTAIFVDSGANFDYFIKTSNYKPLRKIKEFIKKNNMTDEEIKAAVKIVEPLTFINRINYPLLLINSKKGEFMPTLCVNTLYDNLPAHKNKKELKWYETLNPPPISLFRKDSLAWFSQFLLKK